MRYSTDFAIRGVVKLPESPVFNDLKQFVILMKLNFTIKITISQLVVMVGDEKSEISRSRPSVQNTVAPIETVTLILEHLSYD